MTFLVLNVANSVAKSQISLHLRVVQILVQPFIQVYSELLPRVGHFLIKMQGFLVVIFGVGLRILQILP